MPRDEKKVLIQRIDRYIDYWRKTLKDAESICPVRSRSDEMNRVMKGLKRLIGTYQVNESSNGYVKGDSSIKFNPNIRRFSNRIIPLSRGEETAEKRLIENFFDTNNKEGAANLLRFIYMVEFETSSLHYAIMIKEWLGDEDIQLKSYITGRNGINEELESLSERLSEVENSRDNTEKVFFTHWSYMRDNAARTKVEEAVDSINAANKFVLEALKDDETADKNVESVKEILLNGMRSFQEGVNVVLQDSDKKKMVAVKKEQPAQKSAAAWEGLSSMFGSSRDSSGLPKADIKAYQSSPMYPNARDYVDAIMRKLFYDYKQVDDLMKLFLERGSHRQEAQRRVRLWHNGINEVLIGLIDDEGKKKKIPELYYASMSAELRKSTTSQKSLCAELEGFLISKYQFIADGNWRFERKIRTTQKPEDCLKRENIARFRKNMSDYKSSSKNARVSYARINRILTVGVFIGMVIMVLKGMLAMLPASVQSFVLVAKLMGLLTIPASLTLGLLCVATIMIGLNIRNAMKMKGCFKSSLDDFTFNVQAEGVDEEASPQESYSQWLGRGIGTAFSFMNCFGSCRSDQSREEVVEEEGQFVGANRQGHGDGAQQNGFGHFNSQGDQFEMRRTESMESIDLGDESDQGCGPGV